MSTRSALQKARRRYEHLREKAYKRRIAAESAAFSRRWNKAVKDLKKGKINDTWALGEGIKSLFDEWAYRDGDKRKSLREALQVLNLLYKRVMKQGHRNGSNLGEDWDQEA